MAAVLERSLGRGYPCSVTYADLEPLRVFRSQFGPYGQVAQQVEDDELTWSERLELTKRGLLMAVADADLGFMRLSPS